MVKWDLARADSPQVEVKIWSGISQGTLKADFYQTFLDVYHSDAIQEAMLFSTGEIRLIPLHIYNQLLNRSEFIVTKQHRLFEKWQDEAV